jgi:hypothetical protein
LSLPQIHSAAGRIRSTEKSSDLIGKYEKRGTAELIGHSRKKTLKTNMIDP